MNTHRPFSEISHVLQIILIHFRVVGIADTFPQWFELKPNVSGLI